MLKQYKEAIEKSNIISKTDTKGIITFVNDEFCKISGYTKEELLGKNHNIVRHPDVPPQIFKLLWETINAKQIYKSTVKNLAKDGSVFYVNTTLIPILDAHGEIAEFIAIRYDVTKEVFLKEELQKKEAQLEELNNNLQRRVDEKTKELKELNQTLKRRVKEEIAKNEQKQRIMFWQSRLASLGQMLANVAHQWRQPLTELNLTLFSIKKAALCANQEDVASNYAQGMRIVKNMSQTIDDFTNFFKPDKEKHPFKLSQSVEEALVIMQEMIKKERIEIKKDLTEIEILGIPNELTQVIINLIKNSKDAFVQNAIEKREITIAAKKEKNFVLLEFKDNAGGIKEEDLERVFEPYFSTKHPSMGTGLGLFMSKMICEQGFHGFMDVQSKKEITSFSIKLPLEEK